MDGVLWASRHGRVNPTVLLRYAPHLHSICPNVLRGFAVGRFSDRLAIFPGNGLVMGRNRSQHGNSAALS
jgi:hypothetical protein